MTIATLFGHGDDDALSVPPMDGVYRPNNRLDTAERVLELPAIDNLAAVGEVLYCSSGKTLMRVDPQGCSLEAVRRFDGNITMVTVSKAGRIAVGVEGGGLALMEGAGEVGCLDLPVEYRSCITAALFRSEDEMVLAIGSLQHQWSDWKRDLMSHGATGAVATVRLATGEVEILCDKLAFPYGLAFGPRDRLIVSESWHHRVLSLAISGGRPEPLLSELPAYPARLASAADGGYWLALFAPRRQLTEFVLQEDGYRREMMATILPDAWIGPDFTGGSGEEQPLQAGSVRQMGIMKPWAPSRSYGLVVRLDANMVPTASFHSRADGKIHGIASLVELGGQLYAASRGAGVLVRLDANAEKPA